jgi:hypothetical protein
MSAKVGVILSRALARAIDRLVDVDLVDEREIVSGLLAVARVLADHSGMSLCDLQDLVDEMMEEAAIDLAQDEEEEA